MCIRDSSWPAAAAPPPPRGAAARYSGPTAPPQARAPAARPDPQHSVQQGPVAHPLLLAERQHLVHTPDARTDGEDESSDARRACVHCDTPHGARGFWAVLTILEARTAGNGGRRRATSTRRRSGQNTTLTPVRVIGCAERRRCVHALAGCAAARSRPVERSAATFPPGSGLPTMRSPRPVHYPP